MTFAKGIEHNDQKAVRAASAGPEADYPMFETLSTVAMAAADVRAAAIEKFGAEEAKKVTQGQESIAAKVEGTTEKIDGETATLSDGAGEPLRLKKVGDDWRVDLASMPNRDQMAQPSR